MRQTLEVEVAKLTLGVSRSCRRPAHSGRQTGMAHLSLCGMHSALDSAAIGSIYPVLSQRTTRTCIGHVAARKFLDNRR